MHTIRLQISDKIYDKLLDTLNKLQGDDLHIIDEDESFLHDQKIIENRLNNLRKGESKLIDFEEFERNLSEIK